MNKKCLLVSSEPWYQEEYTKMLENFNIKTEHVWEMEQAVGILQSRKENFVFILLDSVMFNPNLKTCEQVFSTLEGFGIPYMIEGQMRNWPENISLKNYYLGQLGSVIGSLAIYLGCKVSEQKITFKEGGCEISEPYSVDVFSENPFLTILKSRGIV